MNRKLENKLEYLLRDRRRRKLTYVVITWSISRSLQRWRNHACRVYIMRVRSTALQPDPAELMAVEGTTARCI